MSRAALVGSIVVALVLGGVVGYSIKATKELSPVPQGTTEVARGDGPLGERSEPKRSYLFSHDAESGTLTEEGSGRYTLALEGVDESALWFEDRPERRSGTVSLKKMLEGFFEKEGEPPPNAAINAVVDDGSQVLMPVELVSADYDSGAGTLTYEVRSLKSDGEATVLPESFGDTAIFIDTIYNECAAFVYNRLNDRFNLISSDLYGYDDWVYQPSVELTTNVQWHSESGFARGCWNDVVYGNDKVRFHFYIADPYSGSNSYTCEVQDSDGNTWNGSPYGCAGPLPQSSLGGDSVAAYFAVCSDQFSLQAQGSGGCQDY